MKLGWKSLLLAATIGLSTVPAAQAHRIWVLPSTFTLSGEEQVITIDGAISNDLFFPNHVAMPLEKMVILAPDGTQSSPENAWKGKVRSVFDVTLNQQGTYKIVDLGGFFFARWEEDGETQRMRGSWERFEKQGILEKEGVQLLYGGRRAETFVTLGAPTKKVFELTGEGVEMVPVTHPNDVYEGEETSFKFYFDGEPAAGLDVTIVKGNDRYRDKVNELKLTTDAEGVVTFTPAVSGRYWMSTEDQKPGEMNDRKMILSSSYSATFEALVP